MSIRSSGSSLRKHSSVSRAILQAVSDVAPPSRENKKSTRRSQHREEDEDGDSRASDFDESEDEMVDAARIE
jgi:hypothetical protein